MIPLQSMTVPVKTASFIGLTQNHTWSQIFTSPHVYGVVEVSSPNEDAQNIGIQALTIISKETSASTISSQKLAEIAFLAFSSGCVTVMLISHDADVLNIVLYGKGKVYLNRNNTVNTLLSEMGSLTGTVNKGDELLLVSSSIIENLNPQVRSGSDAKTQICGVDPTVLKNITSHSLDGGVVLALRFGEESLDFPTPQQNIQHASAEDNHASKLHEAERRDNKQKSDISNLRKPFRLHISKRAAAIGFVSIFFCASLAGGLWYEFIGGDKKKDRETVNRVHELLDEGAALSSLNTKKSLEKLTSAKNIILPLLDRYSDRTDIGKAARDLDNAINQQVVSINRDYSVNPDLFYDVSIVKKGVGIRSLYRDNEMFALLNTDGSILYLDSTTKSMSDTGFVTAGDVFALKDPSIFVYTQKGIDEFNKTGKPTNVIPTDKDWGAIAAMRLYGGNIYLLDTKHSRIWKYSESETGFSPISEYLNVDTLPDFSNAKGFSIDGAVWVVKTDGTILKFESGRESSFQISGLAEPLGSVISLETNDDTKRLYILDSVHSRVVVFEKDGRYIEQYTYGGIIAGSISVLESQKKVFLLSEGKIYVFSMK